MSSLGLAKRVNLLIGGAITGSVYIIHINIDDSKVNMTDIKDIFNPHALGWSGVQRVSRHVDCGLVQVQASQHLQQRV